MEATLEVGFRPAAPEALEPPQSISSQEHAHRSALRGGDCRSPGGGGAILQRPGQRSPGDYEPSFRLREAPWDFFLGCFK